MSWYDDYAFLGNMDGIPSAASQTSPTRFDVMAITDCGDEQYEYGGVGRMTGRLEKVLGETDENQYLWSVLYYDDHGRVVQESHATHRGGWQRTNTGYDFTGHPLSARIIHHDPTAGDMTERYSYSYDAWGRPLTVTHRLENLSPVVLHSYAYDAVGRLESDSRSGDADLRTNYTYNVRSWLTDIKVGGNAQQGTLGETFTEKLYYQNLRPVNPQPGVQWGGNVSAMDWLAGSDSVERRYDFSYDGLSRLTGAGYAEDGVGSNDFSRGYAYDLNGNITSLATPSDTTQVTYAGNQLTGGNNYSYDSNGNLTKDSVRGIDAISYNLLNLPSSITQGQSLPGGPGLTLDGRNYLYTSSGVKLQSKAMLPLNLPGMPDVRERTDYVGNLIYDRTSLQKVLFDGGYVDMSGDSPEYRFFVTDHLGNNRLVADASGAILQTNHYGPYGESLPEGSAVDSGNPYKWGGKEYDDKALAYDFGARHYTSSIPRWTTMDPLCEKYYSLSPYAYCAGNPMNLVDPDGAKLTETAEKYVLEYETKVDEKIKDANSRIAVLKSKITSETSNRKAVRVARRIERQEGTIAEMNSIKKELAALRGSDQTYDLQFDSSLRTETEYLGETSFDYDTGEVVIRMGGYSLGLLAHELKHAYQFETGEMGLGFSFIYDKQDEIEAYQRAALFGESFTSLPSRYNSLPDGPISIRNHPQWMRFLSSDSQEDLNMFFQNRIGPLAIRINGKTYYKK